MTDIFSRRQIMTLLGSMAAAGLASRAVAAPQAGEEAPSGNLRIAFILPSRDDGFYKASQDGGQEAAKALGVELLVAAAEKASAREQALLIAGFVKQKVDAIVIAPVEGNALGPACRRAMQRGVAVVSFKEALPAGVRHVHLSGSSPAGRAEAFLSMLARDIEKGGDIAILAGDRKNEADVGTLSETMREWLKPAYAKLKLAEISYGNRDDAVSYAATGKILDAHPGLKGILAFSPAALAAAARCVHDRQLTGKVFVTGFGRPSQLQTAMEAKTVECFAFNNPVDLGFGAVGIAVALARKAVKPEPGAAIAAGRLGSLTLGQANVATLVPFIVDDKNFAQVAGID